MRSCPVFGPALSRVGAACLAVALLFAAPTAAQSPARFFFEGNGRLVLRHAYFETTLDVRYRHPDGTYDPAALREIEHFFRSREDGREAPVPLRLVELLSYLEERYHPRRMILLSGFRSPEFNTDLRNGGAGVAQASLHTEAMAADLMFVGLDMARLWHRLRDLGTGGVGYYRRNKFLHIDTGPPRFWEAATSRVQENLSADNARVFVRTDFDRYPHLEGAVCSLHGVTAFPVYITPKAALVGPGGSRTITVQPLAGGGAHQNGCFAVEPASDTHQFRVVAVAGAADNSRGSDFEHIVLSTCEPRIGKTPPELESNRIEGPLR